MSTEHQQRVDWQETINTSVQMLIVNPTEMCLVIHVHPRLCSTNSAGGSVTLRPCSSHYYYYNIVSIIRINWDGEPSGHAENTDN
jgi:hypothetical protein